MPTLGSLEMSPSVIDSHGRGSMSFELDSPFGGSQRSQCLAGVAEIQSTKAREGANDSAEEVACANGEAQSIGNAEDQAFHSINYCLAQRQCLKH